MKHGCLFQVSIIKSVVSGCLRKHIITPSRLPSLDNPVILIAWGCYQQLQFLDLDKVRQFIINQGLRGPEGSYRKDGLYTHLQLSKAKGEENKIFCSDITTKEAQGYNE